MSRGFTLLETVVALAITGIVVGGSFMFMEAVTDAEREISERASDTSAYANFERLLSTLVTDFLPTEAEEIALSGDERHATFRSRCKQPGGWTAPCSVGVELESDPPAARIQRSRLPPLEVPLERPRKLLYLEATASRGGVWVSTWRSTVPPLAIGLAAAQDTVLLPVWVRP